MTDLGGFFAEEGVWGGDDFLLGAHRYRVAWVDFLGKVCYNGEIGAL